MFKNSARLVSIFIPKQKIITYNIANICYLCYPYYKTVMTHNAEQESCAKELINIEKR